MRVLFIDPASISSGWAIFEDGVFVKSGTVKVSNDKSFYTTIHNKILSRVPYTRNFKSRSDPYAFGRLFEVHGAYLPLLDEGIDEVHIEMLVMGSRGRIGTHRYTHYSVPMIGCVFAGAGIPVYSDIPIQSWQKHVEWKDERRPLLDYEVASEDELAAIGMGLYYHGE